MYRSCLALFSVGVATVLAGCTTMKQAKLLEPTWFSMEQIAPRIYVRKEASQEQRQKLLDSYEKARRQVTKFYGGLSTDPTIYGCVTRECIESFGGVGDGFSIKSSGILLWSKSFISEAIEHEWSHVELFARTAGPARRTIPNWFHEGLATVVDELPGHSEAVYQEAVSNGFPIPPMSDLR